MEGSNAGTPPDGGWGWMVVFGACLINMVNQSLFANYGLIFGEYVNSISDGSATGVTLVMAINVVSTNVAGLIVGPLLKVLDIRTFTFLGIGCVGTGMIISSFGTAIWHIIIGYSCFTGFGLGLLASGTFLIINDYFTTKKSTAVGISMAGTAVGQMTMPIVIGFLLKKYQYSGTTFILGFVSFTGVIGAIFFKPIMCCKKFAPQQELGESIKPPKEENTSTPKLEAEQKLLTPEGRASVNSRASGSRKVSVSKQILQNHIESNYKDSAIEMANSQFQLKFEEKKHSVFKKVAKALGLNLLKDPVYVHIVVGLGFVYFSNVSFGAMFPIFLHGEAGLPMFETTTTMTTLSSADVLGRVTASELFRRLNFGNRTTFMIGATLLAFTRSVEMLMPSYLYLAVVGFIVGYFRAIAMINQNLVISEYISKDQLPSAVGLNMVMKALITLIIGQPLGYMKDMWSYRVCIHSLNLLTLLVIVSWSVEIIIRKRRTSRKAEEAQDVI
ncbi:unnamed protein product [Phyllotreta striolata]|uniref:Major facilitator superfamily (MFS) profile domain-containing protein n=1 Tax=Phyllotreta striolata TaxID=444603 RepID=A0A9N9XLX5_PHYSR|nr:unnamed protein product [Phyllotreta striolata]